MLTFGLITEGITDFRVLQNILVGYVGSDNIGEIRPLQPNPAAPAHDAAAFGGWYKVFEYCKSSRFVGAFEDNNFVVIHVDTDCAHEKHYEVANTDADGKPLSVEAFTDKVREKISGLIRASVTEEVWQLMQSRILFAIAVSSTECWLLPLHFEDAKTAGNTINCLKKFELKKSGLLNKTKTHTYDTASKDFRKGKLLHSAAEKHPSLRLFVSELHAKVPLTA